MTEYQKMREQQRDIIAAQIEAADERAFYWKIEQEAVTEQKQLEEQEKIDKEALLKVGQDLLIANELEAKKKKEEEERRRREAQSVSQPVQTIQDPLLTVTSSTSNSTCSSNTQSDSGSCSSSDSGSSGGSCD